MKSLKPFKLLALVGAAVLALGVTRLRAHGDEDLALIVRGATGKHRSTHCAARLPE
jgi:hypothetical protein